MIVACCNWRFTVQWSESVEIRDTNSRLNSVKCSIRHKYILKSSIDWHTKLMRQQPYEVVSLNCLPDSHANLGRLIFTFVSTQIGRGDNYVTQNKGQVCVENATLANPRRNQGFRLWHPFSSSAKCEYVYPTLVSTLINFKSTTTILWTEAISQNGYQIGQRYPKPWKNSDSCGAGSRNVKHPWSTAIFCNKLLKFKALTSVQSTPSWH